MKLPSSACPGKPLRRVFVGDKPKKMMLGATGIQSYADCSITITITITITIIITITITITITLIVITIIISIFIIIIILISRF